MALTEAPHPSHEVGGQTTAAGQPRGKGTTTQLDLDALRHHPAVIRTLEIIPEVCREPFLRCVRNEWQTHHLRAEGRSESLIRPHAANALNAWSVVGRRDLSEAERAEVMALREVIREAIHKEGGGQ